MIHKQGFHQACSRAIFDEFLKQVSQRKFILKGDIESWNKNCRESDLNE